MVNLHDVFTFKEQFAMGASAFLPFEQLGYSLVSLRMLPHAGTPIDPIPIIRTPLALHFDVSLDRYVGVMAHFPDRFPGVGCKTPTPAFVNEPILVHYPIRGFVGMTLQSPTSQGYK